MMKLKCLGVWVIRRPPTDYGAQGIINLNQKENPLPRVTLRQHSQLWKTN